MPTEVHTDPTSPNDLWRRAIVGTPDLALERYPKITDDMHADGAPKLDRGFTLPDVSYTTRKLVWDIR